MFGKKKTFQQEDPNMKILFEEMDRLISGNYAAADVDRFPDKYVGEKLNELILAVKKANNNFVMRANEAMQSIGDNSFSKAMLDQVDVQAGIIQNMEHSGEELEHSINDINLSVERIRTNTHNVLDDTRECVDLIRGNVSTVNEATTEIRKINQQVHEFQDKIDKINQIVDVVKKVASQSNLLALNASIEAARAGEAGRGFAVVADQVSELSNSTEQSADDIVMYVTELQESISVLAKTMDETTNKLEEGNRKVEHSIKSIDDIENKMNDISDEIDSIYNAVEQQSGVTKEFGDVIREMKDSYNLLSDNCTNTGVHIYKIGRYIDTLRSDMFRGFAQVTMLDRLRIFEIDHFILTWRVYNNAVGFEQLKITQLNNPTGPKACKIGLWLQEQKDPRIIETPQFKNVDAMHKKLHDYATRSWEAKDKGDVALAIEIFEQQMDVFQEFKAAIQALMDVYRGIGETEVTEIVVFRK